MVSSMNELKNPEINDTNDGKAKVEEVDISTTTEWTPEQEVLLLYSLLGHKPVGPNKHFHMCVIHDRLSNAMNKKISSKDIWKKLNKMYDLEALDEAEEEQTALTRVNVNFKLPRKIFKPFMQAKIIGKAIKHKKEKESVKSQQTTGKNKTSTHTDEVNEKVGKKEQLKRGGKKNILPLKENLKKVNAKELNKKDTIKKEPVKEIRKRGIKDDEKMEPPAPKSLPDIKKETTSRDKESSVRSTKRDSLAKTVPEQTKKDGENKKIEQKKTPAQRGVATNRSETIKQEASRRSDAKTPKSDTPKTTRMESPKKVVIIDKKKETPEKVNKLRARDRRGTEIEVAEVKVAGTKRERPKDPTPNKGGDTSEGPPAKKAKIVITKSRLTRNTAEPQPTTASAVTSPQKRRGRP